MKVVIVNPPTLSGTKYTREGRCEQRLNSFQYAMVPISLPMVAGVLEQNGHGVVILDCFASDMDVECLKHRLRLENAGLVLFNMSTATSASDLQVIDLCRPATKAHFTVIGIHATSLPEEVLSGCTLDSVIRREPESTAGELVEAVERGADLRGVLGLSYKDADGKVVHNEDRPFNECLDDLPFAARHLLDNAKYTLPVINEPYTLIITSRGCPHACIYCTAHQYYGKKLRLRSAPNAVDEMKQCLERHGIRNFLMWSDTFSQDRKFVLDVCLEIKRQGLQNRIRWMANSRVDHVDRELLAEMRSSGCIGVSYGVESGDDEILRAMKKGANARQGREAVRLTKEAGIEVLIYIILGLPGETPATIRRTMEYVKELDPDYAQFYCAVPFPKTELEALAKEKGWIATDDYSQYEFSQPLLNMPGLSLEELRRARSRALRAFYLRPAYIWKRLVRLRSWDDLRLSLAQGWDFARNWIWVPASEATDSDNFASTYRSSEFAPPSLRSRIWRKAPWRR